MLIYDNFRSANRASGLEMMLSTQARVVEFILHQRDAAPDENTILVSHGDVVRVALLYCPGMPLDFIHRLQVDVASVSSLWIDKCRLDVFPLNEKPD